MKEGELQALEVVGEFSSCDSVIPWNPRKPSREISASWSSFGNTTSADRTWGFGEGFVEGMMGSWASKPVATRPSELKD